MGLIGVNDVKPVFSQELSDLQRGSAPAASHIDNMHACTEIGCVRCQQRIASGQQFRAVPVFEQALQKKQRLMLPPAIITAEVDYEWPHPLHVRKFRSDLGKTDAF